MNTPDYMLDKYLGVPKGGAELVSPSAIAPLEPAGPLPVVGSGGAVVWRKACACKSQSATNRIITEQRQDEKTHALLLVATFLPMPSCLECNTPWTMEEPDNPSISRER